MDKAIGQFEFRRRPRSNSIWVRARARSHQRGTSANRVLSDSRIELRPNAVVVFPDRAFIYRGEASALCRGKFRPRSQPVGKKRHRSSDAFRENINFFVAFLFPLR